MSKIFEQHGAAIKELTEEGKTNREIAKELNIGKTTVGTIVKKYGFEKYKISLNEVQKEVLVGTIIGDGCLFKSTEGSQARLSLSHSLAQKEYFYYKYEIMKPIIRTAPYERSWFDKRTKKEYSEVKFQTRVHPMFTKLWESFYNDGKKIIRPHHLKDRGELCMAVKYFDDGWKHGEKAYSIAMNDYDLKSVETFREWMKEKFDITTNMHREKSVYIPVADAHKLKKILMKYATDDVKYKI